MRLNKSPTNCASAVGLGSLSDGRCDQLVDESKQILGSEISEVHFRLLQITNDKNKPLESSSIWHRLGGSPLPLKDPRDQHNLFLCQLAPRREYELFSRMDVVAAKVGTCCSVSGWLVG